MFMITHENEMISTVYLIVYTRLELRTRYIERSSKIELFSSIRMFAPIQRTSDFFTRNGYTFVCLVQLIFGCIYSFTFFVF